MDLENLLLRKEELPIIFGRCFEVPIHPKLLSPEIELDETIAKTVFPIAAKEFYTDLLDYTNQLKDSEEKEWYENVFLKQEPHIKIEGFSQVVEPLTWKDGINVKDNGFPYGLSISRDAGGLYFSDNSGECKTFVPFRNHRYIKLKKNKLVNYKCDDSGGEEGVFVWIYYPHNIDHYPGALFLRNWAILTLNECLKQIFKS